MAPGTTLFANIIPTLTNQLENVAVEALGYILVNSEAARQGLSDILRAGHSEIGPIRQIQTQLTEEDGNRPDLACTDGRGIKRVLIEAKFWAALGDSQPNHYLASLPEDGPAALLFVAPAERIETLWVDVCQRASKDYDLKHEATSGDLRSVSLNSGERLLMVTSWRALLDNMAVHASNVGDAQTESNIVQLRGLAIREDTDAFLPWHPEDLGQGLPRRLVHLSALVAEAAQQLQMAGWADFGRYAWTHQLYGTGRYLLLAGVLVWFGSNYEKWGQRGHTPLWVQFQNFDNMEQDDYEEMNIRMEAFNREDAAGGIDDLGWTAVYLPAGKERGAVVESLVNQLADIGRLIDPGGPTHGMSA